MSNWFLPNYIEQAKNTLLFNEIARDGLITSNHVTRSLQEDLIKEEFDEVCEAFTSQNKENFLKELCDLFVVSSFMIYLIDKELFEQGDCFVFDRKCGAPPINMALSILSDLVLLQDWQGIVKTTIGLLSVVDADSIRAMKVVTANNLSKFLRYDSSLMLKYDEMARTIELNSNGRYSNVMWSKYRDWVVFKDFRGKIMKPISFQSVDLSPFIKGVV